MFSGSEYEYIAFPKLNHVKVGFVDIVFRRPHIHRELEMGLVLDGRASLTVNGNQFPIGRGSLYFVNANEAHDIVAEDQGRVRIVYIQISNRFCQDYLHLFRNLEVQWNDLTRRLSPQDNLTLTRLMLDVCHAYLDEGSLCLLQSMKAICQLFYQLLSTVPYRHFDEAAYQSRKRKTIRLQRITEYINEHYAEKLSLAALAEMEGVSVTHLSHFIRDNLNMTFQDYVSNLRLEKAVQLIRYTSLRLTDICLECGFSDIKYLNKAFKQQFNCLPRDYRAEYVEERVQQARDSEDQFYASERQGRAWLEGFLNAFEDEYRGLAD